jgi:hypothetical protein
MRSWCQVKLLVSILKNKKIFFNAESQGRKGIAFTIFLAFLRLRGERYSVLAMLS